MRLREVDVGGFARAGCDRCLIDGDNEVCNDNGEPRHGCDKMSGRPNQQTTRAVADDATQQTTARRRRKAAGSYATTADDTRATMLRRTDVGQCVSVTVRHRITKASDTRGT